MHVDLNPILQTIVGLAALALSTTGGWALARLAAKLGIQANAVAMANYQHALDSSIAVGISKATDLIARKGWDHPEVKNTAIATGLSVMSSRFADALSDVGLNPAKDADGVQTKIRDALDRTFPVVAGELAASPVTPPADLTMATVPEQEPEPVAAQPAALEPDAIATLTGAVSTLVASHETTNALLGKLVGQGALPAVEPEAPVAEPVLQPLTGLVTAVPSPGLPVGAPAAA